MYLLRISWHGNVDEALIIVPQNNAPQHSAALEEAAAMLGAYAGALEIEEVIELPPTARLDSLRPYIG